MERAGRDKEQEMLLEIGEIRLSVFSLLEREAGIIVEDGCWIYKDEATGAKVKVSRPVGVLMALRGDYGAGSMLILKSIDLQESGENGLVLCVYNGPDRVWHKANLPIIKRGVKLPISDPHFSPVWFILNLDFAFEGDKFGDWRLVCPERDKRNEPKQKLNFYRKVGKMLGLTRSKPRLKL